MAKKDFLNDVNSKVENESFAQEKFEKIKPDLTKYYIFAAVAVVAIVAVYIFMNRKTEIPDFAGWTETEVATWASQNNMVLSVQSEYDLSTADTVLSQNPEVGAELKSGSSIALVISLGADPDELITLPEFDSSWTKTDIVTWLKENQIDSYTFSTEVNDNVISSSFLSYSIPSSTEAAFTRSDEIEFVTAISSDSETVTMVDFSSYTEDQIRIWASENSLTVSISYQFSTLYAQNKVISQSIDTDTDVSKNSNFSVVISKGEAIKLVDFNDYNPTDAQTWATENGIKVTIYYEYNSSLSKDELIWQDVSASTVLEAGDEVKLFYSLGTTVSLSSYEGKTLSDFQAAIDILNDKRANITITTSYQYDNSIAINKIVSQTPTDTNIALGSTINVVVSKGALISVPNFSSYITAGDVSKTYNDINTACKDLNCRISMNDVSGDTITVSQSVASGTLQSAADWIDISISY